MSEPDSYLTFHHEGSREFIINKSRFIGYGAPAETEEEALNFLRKIRTERKDASHNCYGYVIGRNSGIMRYSDDGEPSGTAGLPIIEVLKNKHVVNCAVVVTRYFGGILLGAGGLVRAYTQGAVAACEGAAIVSMEKTDKYLCEVPYSLWDKVRYFLGQLPVQLVSTEYAAAVSFSIMVKTSDAPMVNEKLVSITDGGVFSILEDSFYHPWNLPE